MTEAPSGTPPPAPLQLLAKVENLALALILAAMVLLPVTAVLLRWTVGWPLASANLLTQYLNLWLAMLGALVAARAGRHLKLSTGELMKLSSRAQTWVRSGTTAVSVAVTALLALASWKFLQAELHTGGEMAAGVPKWALQGAMPLGFAGMAFYLTWQNNASWRGRLLALLVTLGALSLALVPVGSRTPAVWAGAVTLLGSVALGAPIYMLMGGMAMLLLYGQPIPSPIAAVPLETFGLVASPTLPAIPLFTLAGYLLAEGGASKRLVNVFQHVFGWLPGGIAVAAVLVCAFFTTFTGASGVTILALGGLLLPILTRAGYSERFSIGLLMASGSIGLLFPPSLPVILYGVISHVPIDRLFVAGVVPGVLLVALVGMLGVIHAVRNGITRSTLDPALALRSLWDAKWEAFLPVGVLVGIFGGFLTIFEAAAFTAAYAFISEVVIHRDIKWRGDLLRVFTECGTLMGGVMIILGVALGLTNFLIDAEVPMRVAHWASEHIGSRLLFLLLLNGFLLLVGALMDIFSAIVVVVPLIVPLATAFGVNPVHLGILFLANLELGYLTPPVGMNLFLASYRFNKPLTEVYRMGLPFLGVLLLGVLLITYVPAMTLWASGDEDPTSGVNMDELNDVSAPPALPLGTIDLDAELGEDAPTRPLGAIDIEAEMKALDDEPAKKALGAIDIEAEMKALDDEPAKKPLGAIDIEAEMKALDDEPATPGE